MADPSVLEVLAGLPVTLKVVRRMRGSSQREVARECGISFSTVCRIEAGEDCTLSSAVAVLRWIAKEAV